MCVCVCVSWVVDQLTTVIFFVNPFRWKENLFVNHLHYTLLAILVQSFLYLLFWLKEKF
jgi:hypothetical protein